MSAVHSDFDLAFDAGAHIAARDGEVWGVSVEPAGTLQLRSGQVLVGDPFVGGLSGTPLRRAVAPGRYPVDLSIVQLSSDHRRVAAIRMRVSDAPVARWEPAWFAGQVETSETDSLPGYGVDAGTGCFACAETAPALDTEAAGERLLEAYASQPTSVAHPDAPEACVTCHSGWGDGFYVSWWGLDAQGEPVCLVTDFEVMVVARYATMELPLPLARGALVHPLSDSLGVRLRRPWLAPSRLEVQYPASLLPRVRVLHIDGSHRVVPPKHGVLGTAKFELGTTAPDDVLELGFVDGLQALERLATGGVASSEVQL